MTESFNRKLGRLAQNVSGTGSITSNAATASAWQTARTITLSGDLSGSVSIDGSSNVSLTATVSGDAVVLGTDTTGNYVATIAAGSGISVSGSGSETAAVTVSIDNTVATLSGSQTLTNKTISGADNTLSNISNSSLTNSSITINGGSVSLGGTRTLVTDDIAEDGSPSNLWYTDTRSRAAISVTDAGGDGSLSYNSGSGVITYTGPSAAEVRAHFSAGTGVSISSGQISIGQAVATTDNVTFAGVTADNIRVGVTGANEIDTSSGNLTIDSTGGTTVLDDDVNVTGNLLVDGNLTVSGTTVTVNTTNLAVEDNMIYLNNGSAVANPDLGFAGNYNDGTYRHAGLFRDATDGVWKFFHQYTPEPDASAYIDITHGSFALAPVQASSFTGSLTGNVTGNASTATAWATARTLTLSGDVTGTSTAFDGSGNISITTTIAANSVALGTDTTGDYVAAVAVAGTGLSVAGSGENATYTITSNATSANTGSTIVARDASGNFTAGTITAALSGNATTATNISGYSGTYWTSNNDGTGSGLDADLLDGQQGAYYAAASSLSSYLPLSGGMITGNLGVQTGYFQLVTGSILASNASTRGFIVDGNYTNGQFRHRWRKYDDGGGIPLYLDYAHATADSYTAIARFGGGGTYRELDVYGTFSATTVLQGTNQVLHAGNYNSYSPTLTGTGASGTWSINVTGTAGSISGFNNPTAASTANTIAYRTSLGDIAVRELILEVGVQSFTPSSMVAIYPTTNQAVKVDAAGARNFLDVPTRSGGNASGTWSINVTGSAGSSTSASYARYIPTNYIGGQQLNPQTYFNNGVGLNVAMTASVGYWTDTLWINGYSGGDVLSMCALHTSRTGAPTMWISTQQSTATSYGTFYEFLTAYNYTNYSPSLTGGGASGNWSINSSTATILKSVNTTTSTTSTWNPQSLTYQAWGQGFAHSSISGDTGDIVMWLRASQYSAGGTELCMIIDGDYFAGTGQHKVLHAGNYSSYALPLSGGALTGQLVLNQNIASPSNYYNGLQMEVRATSGTAGIGLHRNGYSHCGIYHDTTNYLKFNFNGGTVTMDSGMGTLLGTGNYSSYALPLSGGTMSGAISTPAGTSIYIGSQNIATSSRLIINWYTDSDYQYLIGKRAGTWTQPMDIAFYTGIRYHAHSSYNGHIFYTAGYDSTEAFSIGKGDSHVRVVNNLFVSTGNTTGGGIVLADDGDIVDLNDGYCAMRFSYGVRIHAGNRTGGAVIALRETGNIIASANITAYGSPSDARKKNTIEQLTGALDIVKQLRGVTFNWNEDTDEAQYTKLKEDIGFIAQEVREVVPKIVREDAEGYLSIRDRALIPILVEAIKEQQSEIDELKNRLTKLQ